MLKKLNEDSKSQLLSKARKGANYKGDQSKGKNRYERSKQSSLSNSVAEYNRLNMNKFFKDDILDVNIIVHGETDDYLVGISFSGILKLIQDETAKDPDIKIDRRLIWKVLRRALKSERNIKVKCQCPDWQYRFGYWASKNDFILGDKENRPSDKTNPKDNLGSACKHVILVLNTTNSWVVKLGSVINNYIKYIKDHYEANYLEIIYPKLYGHEYEEPVQLGLFDKDELDSTFDTATNISRNTTKDQDRLDAEDELAKSDVSIGNEVGATRGQFTKGTAPKPSIRQVVPISDDEQLELDLS